jgi:hypothetical protein
MPSRFLYTQLVHMQYHCIGPMHESCLRQLDPAMLGTTPRMRLGLPCLASKVTYHWQDCMQVTGPNSTEANNERANEAKTYQINDVSEKKNGRPLLFQLE